jgi:hypothetical protein
VSMVMNMIYYFLLHHHPGMFLLSHLKQRFIRLPPLPQQQWRRHGSRGISSLNRVNGPGRLDMFDPGIRYVWPGLDMSDHRLDMFG